MRRILLAGLLSAAAPMAIATAATTNWTGSAGTNSWFTAGNWDNGVPSVALDAVVNTGRPTVDQAAGTANTLSIFSSGFVSNNSVTIASGNTLTVTNGITDNASLFVTGTLVTPTITGTGVVSFSGTRTVSTVLSGSLGVAATSGVITLTGANTYTGTTSLTNGVTFVSGGTNAFGSGGIDFTGTTGVLDLNGFNQTATTLTADTSILIGHYSGLVTNNGAQAATLTLTGNGGSPQYDGSITGAISLVKTGTSEQILAGGTLSYTGSTTVSGGILSIRGQNLSASSGMTVNSGGTLTGFGTVSSLAVQSGGTLSLGNSPRQTASLTVNGNLTLASGAVVVADADSTTVDTVNVTGTAAINGTLNVNFASGLTAGRQYTLFSSTGTLSGAFSVVNFTGVPANFSSNVTYDSHNVFLNLNGPPGITNWRGSTGSWFTAGNWDNGVPNGALDTIVSTGNVTVDQAGGTAKSLSLASGRDTRAVVTIATAGSLTVSNSLTIANTSGLIVNGTLATPGITDNGGVEFGGTRTVTTPISGSGSVSVSAGIVTLNGDDTYTGSTGVSSGATLRAGRVNAFGNAGPLNPNGTVDLNGFNQTVGGIFAQGTTGLITNNGTQAAVLTVIVPGGSPQYGGTISDGTGGLSVVFAGTGEQIVTGVMTYTGATTVSGSVLSIRNVNLSSSSGLTIASGGTLTGSGTVSSMTVQSGGKLSLGNIGSNSIGSLAVNGNLTLASGAIVAVDAYATEVDKVTVNGTAAINGTLNVDLHTGSKTLQYALISSTGTLSGTFANVNFTGTPENFTSTITYDAHDVFLNLAPTPGTTTWSGGSGSWFTAGNWYSGVPDATLNAFVTQGAASVDQVGGRAKSLSITGGSVNVTAGNSLSVDNGVTTSGFGSLTVTGTLATSTVTNNGTLNINGTLTASAITGSGVTNISGSRTMTTPISGTGGVTITSGVVTLSGSNSYTGSTRVSNGATLRAGSATAFGSNSDLSFAAGPLNTVDLNGFNLSFAGLNADGPSRTGPYTGLITNNGTNAVTLTLTGNGGSPQYDGNISDGTAAISLVKTGRSEQIVTGALTYTGSTTLNGGVLSLRNVDLSSSSSLTIASGTLTGSGTVSSTTVLNGGGLSPGNTGAGTIGTLAVNGNLSLASGSQVSLDVNATRGDAVTVTGTAAINGELDVAFLSDNYATRQYTLISSTGALTGAFANVYFSNVPTNFASVVTYDAHDVFLNLSPFAFSPNTVANVNSGTVDVNGSQTTGGLASSNPGGTVNLVGNSLLTDDQSSNTTFYGVISGTGKFNKIGTGTLILNGVNTYTGGTGVSGGVLEIGDATHPDASIRGPIAVGSGGTLSGHGAVSGAVTVASGGNLQPGGTIGTLTVASATFQSGSTYTVETNAAGQGNLTVATGAITINSGTSLVVTPDAPVSSYARTTNYTILQAGGGITGTFGTTTSTAASLLPSVSYTANTATLTLIRPDLLATAATTPNQRGVATAIAAGGLSPILTTLAPQSDAAIATSFGQMSGDIHASLRSAAVEDSRIIRDTVLDHLNGHSEGVAVWAAGFGGYGSISTDGNASGLHHDSAGFIAGADMAIGGGLRLGVAGGYTGNAARTTATPASVRGNSGHVIAYASWLGDNITLKAGGDFGWGDANVTRTVTSLGQTLTDRQDQQTSQVFAEGGYRFATDLAMVEPYVGIAGISARTGAFAETGGDAALSGGEVTDTQTYSTLGLRAALAPVTSLAGIVPHIDLGWQHAFSTLRPGQTLLLQGVNQSFAVLGAPLASDAAAARAGFTVKLAPDVALSVDYDGSFANRVQNNAVRGGLEWTF